MCIKEPHYAKKYKEARKTHTDDPAKDVMQHEDSVIQYVECDDVNGQTLEFKKLPHEHATTLTAKRLNRQLGDAEGYVMHNGTKIPSGEHKLYILENHKPRLMYGGNISGGEHMDKNAANILADFLDKIIARSQGFRA